ncbi:hypothetical protein JCM8547_002729 [Rhodosporidiobolus lusitaniae]
MPRIFSSGDQQLSQLTPSPSPNDHWLVKIFGDPSSYRSPLRTAAFLGYYNVDPEQRHALIQQCASVPAALLEAFKQEGQLGRVQAERAVESEWEMTLESRGNNHLIVTYTALSSDYVSIHDPYRGLPLPRGTRALHGDHHTPAERPEVAFFFQPFEEEDHKNALFPAQPHRIVNLAVSHPSSSPGSPFPPLRVPPYAPLEALLARPSFAAHFTYLSSSVSPSSGTASATYLWQTLRGTTAGASLRHEFIAPTRREAMESGEKGLCEVEVRFVLPGVRKGAYVPQERRREERVRRRDVLKEGLRQRLV